MDQRETEASSKFFVKLGQPVSVWAQAIGFPDKLQPFSRHYDPAGL